MFLFRVSCVSLLILTSASLPSFSASHTAKDQILFALAEKFLTNDILKLIDEFKKKSEKTSASEIITYSNTDKKTNKNIGKYLLDLMFEKGIFENLEDLNQFFKNIIRFDLSYLLEQQYSEESRLIPIENIQQKLSPLSVTIQQYP